METKTEVQQLRDAISSWSIEEEDQIRHLVNEGKTTSEIARNMGLHWSTIAKIREKTGLSPDGLGMKDIEGNAALQELACEQGPLMHKQFQEKRGYGYAVYSIVGGHEAWKNTPNAEKRLSGLIAVVREGGYNGTSDIPTLTALLRREGFEAVSEAGAMNPANMKNRR